MTNPTGDLVDPQVISATLAKSWKFLSGEDREFKALDSITPPEYQEHTYYLPVEVEDAGKRYAVSVLLHRSDATVVASFMFGMEPSELSEADLQDACGEICNVMSSRHLLKLSNEARITLGMPKYLHKQTYLETITQGQLEAAYQSTLGDRTVYVLVCDLTASTHVQAAID
ncbi:MAG: hypothetical protein EBR27_04180 [Betaproteobacteria bacterium]|nr:hypothetical protein [Betaproteobacteria bacterium]NBY70844.1 hypothetical protein [Betaproteobacteria bacterium]